MGYMGEVNTGYGVEGIYAGLGCASLDNKCKNVESKNRDF